MVKLLNEMSLLIMFVLFVYLKQVAVQVLLLVFFFC